ncbi:MAG: hypothetical protein LBI87_13795, partial [Candidatus Accumulibacter sp.]|nr:hypothetical protein [Accumulibacter sp.]
HVRGKGQRTEIGHDTNCSVLSRFTFHVPLFTAVNAFTSSGPLGRNVLVILGEHGEHGEKQSPCHSLGRLESGLPLPSLLPSPSSFLPSRRAPPRMDVIGCLFEDKLLIQFLADTMPRGAIEIQ